MIAKKNQRLQKLRARILFINISLIVYQELIHVQYIAISIISKRVNPPMRLSCRSESPLQRNHMCNPTPTQ